MHDIFGAPCRNAIGAGSELKSFDIDNSHGEKALDRVLKDIVAESQAMPGVKVGWARLLRAIYHLFHEMVNVL